jgi:hypothetical protein
MYSEIGYNNLTLPLRSPNKTADEDSDSFTSTYHAPVWPKKPRISTACALMSWVFGFLVIFLMGFVTAMMYNDNEHTRLFGTYEIGFKTEHICKSYILN